MPINPTKQIQKQVSTKSETSGVTQIDFIPGMPPDMNLPGSNAIMRNSMPIVEITPGEPSFKKGLDLFTRIPVWDKPGTGYHTLLKQHGYSFPPGQTSLKLAFLADSFPTDSFTNEYGENFLQGLTNVASEGAQSIIQIAGGRSVSEAAKNLMAALLPEGLAEAANAGMAKLEAALGAVGMKNAAAMANKMLAGARIDFPMVWKTSGFSPSYTMTVRLYNPNPRSVESTRKYIIGPIAALMLLAVPISEDGSTYTWPFIHKIYSPGIYDLDPAFISNITVIKGGDQQQIAWNQRMGMVDVRLDFGSLYSSMMATGTTKERKDRPTLKKYLDGMEQYKEVTDRQGLSGFQDPKFKLAETKKIPATKVEKTSEQKQNPTSRVSSSLRTKYNDILNQVPDSIKDIFD